MSKRTPRGHGVKQILETAMGRLCGPNDKLICDPISWKHHKYAWKLWHYVLVDANTLASVLTQEERSWYKKEHAKNGIASAVAEAEPYTQEAHRAEAKLAQHNAVHLHGVDQGEQHADAMAGGRLAAESLVEAGQPPPPVHPPPVSLTAAGPSSSDLSEVEQPVASRPPASPSLRENPLLDESSQCDEDVDVQNLFGSDSE